MTTLGRVRVVSESPDTARTPLAVELPVLTAEGHRRIASREVHAREVAEGLVASARAEAAAILAEAHAAAEAVTREAAAEARAGEQARVAALYLRMKQEDERRAERDLDRAVALAVALSERLLGDALEHDPQLAIKLANQALGEARGARRATIDACPLDAEVLRRHLVDTGFDLQSVDVRTDPSLTPGSLRIATNLGTLDARLVPQLERLARALRDTLEPTWLESSGRDGAGPRSNPK